MDEVADGTAWGLQWTYRNNDFVQFALSTDSNLNGTVSVSVSGSGLFRNSPCSEHAHILHCRKSYPIANGREYEFRETIIATSGTNNWWSFQITDHYTGVTTDVATIGIPKRTQPENFTDYEVYLNPYPWTPECYDFSATIARFAAVTEQTEGRTAVKHQLTLKQLMFSAACSGLTPVEFPNGTFKGSGLGDIAQLQMGG